MLRNRRIEGVRLIFVQVGHRVAVEDFVVVVVIVVEEEALVALLDAIQFC